jgi:NAD(P)-dependent dehydrogenase (short-subunit alcohol dehydrogenase family)
MNSPHTPTVVITGATSGIGRATAVRFAEDRARVALVARGSDGLDATARQVEEAGGTALPIATDVSDPDAVAEAGRRAEETLGEIDIWINNAMTTVFSFFEDTEPDEFRRATEVTYLGVVWGTRTALQHMRPRDRGTIIQVGSALAYRGIPLQSAYCGSKHAIKGFTESVRTELGHAGSDIHLGMVQLPAVNTPQFSHCRSSFDRHPMPVPPIYQPEVAAAAIQLAVDKRRREVYVGLPTVLTILGNKVSSRFMDWYLARNGVDSQLTDLPADPRNAKGNLFEPVAGDAGARGIFDSRSRAWSPELWISEHRGSLTTAALGALALGLMAAKS